MLLNQEMFDTVEQRLMESGAIARFEAENGKILGRMMITLGECPEDLELEIPDDETVFICSFDFYDYTIGMSINPETMESSSGLWITPQGDADTPHPSEDWTRLFVNILVQSLQEGMEENGVYGIPIYVFVNNDSEMVIVPTQP